MQKIKIFLNQFPRHWVVAASAWGSKIVTAFVQIISIRTLLLYLGEEQYAVYAIIMSLSTWFLTLDCGIGAALQNFISECRSKNQSYDRYLKSALQISILLFFIFVALLSIVSPFMQEKILSNYLSIKELQTINIIGIIGTVFIATAMTSITYRVYFALQKGYISNILPALGLVLSMILIVPANKYFKEDASILTALLIFTLPQLFMAAFPYVKVFKNCFFRILDFDKQALKELFIRGIKFGGYLIMATAALQLDYIIMSQTADASGITTYNIFSKLFLMLLFINGTLLAASWPVSSELFSSGNYGAIKKMLQKYLIFGISIIIAGSVGIYLFSGFIIKILAPETSISVSLPLIALFCVYFILRVWTDTFGMFLLSINAIRIFWIYIPLQALVCACSAYFLSLRYGINGILAGLILSFLFTSCILLPYKTWKIFKSKENIS